jgi:hypothetical protein
MALGWRVRTPWTTLTNSGSHGAAPSRNLSFRCGQRPSVHRLQRCRGPSGPRASGAAAAPHVHRHTRVQSPASGVTGAPQGTLRTPYGERWPGRHRANAERSCSRRPSPVRWPGPEGVEHTHPGKRDDRAGKSSGEYYLTSTQTHRRPVGASMSCNPSLS